MHPAHVLFLEREKVRMPENEATELEWLKWFYMNADFGPADGDVQHHMRQQFTQETGKTLPPGYAEEE